MEEMLAWTLHRIPHYISQITRSSDTSIQAANERNEAILRPRCGVQLVGAALTPEQQPPTTTNLTTPKSAHLLILPATPK